MTLPLRTAAWIVVLLPLPALPETVPDLAPLVRALAEATDVAARQAALDAALAVPGVGVREWTEALRATAPATGAARSRELALTLPSGRQVTCRLAEPPGYDPAHPWPLLIIGHGTGLDSRSSLALWQAEAARAGLLLACPDSASTPESWDFSHEERAVLLETLTALKRGWNVDEDRVFVGGLSKGAHAAWDLGFRYPHLWAGLVPECGRPYNHGLIKTGGFDYLENAPGMQIYHLQGALDDPPLVAGARDGCAALKALGGDATYTEFPDRGHEPFPDQYPAVTTWMATHARPSMPKRTFCRCHDLRYGRRDWSEILAFDDAVVGENPRKLSLKGKPADTPEGLDRDKRRHMLEGSAVLEVELTGPNRVTVKARHVREFALYLSEDLFDLTKPVTVTVNGKPAFKGPVEASPRTLLEGFARDLDRRRLFAASLRIRVP